MFSTNPISLELLSQLKLLELQAQAAPAQCPQYCSWLNRFQRWMQTSRQGSAT